MKKIAIFAAVFLAVATLSAQAVKAPVNQVLNSSFEMIDAKTSKAKYWNFSKASTIIKGEKGNQAKINGGIHQYLTANKVWQSSKPRKIQYSFTVSGKGKLSVTFFRYSDTPNPKEKHGYTRKFLPHSLNKVVVLTEKPQTVTGTYTIAANEWVALSISALDAVVDDVTVDVIQETTPAK